MNNTERVGRSRSCESVRAGVGRIARRRLAMGLTGGLLALLVVTGAWAEGHSAAFRQQLSDVGVLPLPPASGADQATIDLGRSLFFDPELSGNRDISCASCHHPSQATGDGRPLPAGTGATGLGSDRNQPADREIVPRNAPEVFNRGDGRWKSMFWDSRVAQQGGAMVTPAGPALPPGLDSVLAAQAMFPVTSRTEMRGKLGDRDIRGQINELASIDDADLSGMWGAIMNRLQAIPAYEAAFAAAYPGVPRENLGFEHAANAIAKFEEAAFSPTDSAWDRFLAGDDNALTASALRGAQHFYGGSCASCHSGSLMTDQQHHNLAVPQLGPGKDPVSGLDEGRFLQTGNEADRFAFRTPPLRNVALTGPWMHNGAFSQLEDVIRHKFDPDGSLRNYYVSQLPAFLQATVRMDDATLAALTESIDPLLPAGEALTDDQLNDLLAFLFSLTSPSIDQLLGATPESVLSGLQVDTLPPSEIQVGYDPSDGKLYLLGSEGMAVDAFFLRIREDETLGEAGFEFFTGVAPWTSDEDIVLSDTADAQSYVDYRAEPTMVLHPGDSLAGLLPAGLSDVMVGSYLTAAYRLSGSPTLWTTDVRVVPEPTGLLVGILAFSIVVGVIRRRDR